MRLPLLLLGLTALLVSPPLRAEETVRIAIVEGARQIGLSGRGLEVRKLEVGERYSAAPGGRSEVTLADGRLLLDGTAVEAPDGVKFRSTDFVQVAGKPVRGQIEVRLQGKGLIAINVVPLEDYLMAVLGSEMPPSFPVEALKAQAVAARTYAVQRKIAAWGRPYHMGATVLHQVYGGARAEVERTREVVRATRGQVLVFHMEPIEAYFHSSCGGRTESGDEALGRPLAYLKAVPCECATRRDGGWTVTLGWAELKRALGPVEGLEVVERTPSGRVKRVRLTTPGGRRLMSGIELRRLLGYDRLRSLAFEVSRSATGLTFQGRGFGHGAGLCQWGARLLAEKGWDFQRILAHYYPGAELRQMY